MYFILMLTHGDKTVSDALDVLEQVLPLNLQHIGFKDIGVSHETLAELNGRIKNAGITSYMEVVSETPEACLESARVAVDIGVDRLLGGTDIGAVKAVLSGSNIAYFPFPGCPVDHPTRLEGRPEDIARDCRRFMAEGAAGADLLAYRAVDAEPIDLVKAARAALDGGELIVAGSIVERDQIERLEDAGVDGFTIGSALFDGEFAPGRDGLAAQVQAVLDCLRPPYG
jgi:uncharacterized protein related to proFAR isomerase